MYPSGSWAGFWQQEGWGRQSMTAFTLMFRNGTLHGQGVDVIGVFTILGSYDQSNGHLRWAKRYVDSHTVLYTGQPNGEGGVTGTWVVQSDDVKNKGPFSIHPVIEAVPMDVEIPEIVPR